MNSDCVIAIYIQPRDTFFVEDWYVYWSFSMRSISCQVAVTGCLSSSDFTKNSFAFASGDPLHSNAFLPCAALAFLVTTAN
jgi:hypothetical protein